MTNDEIITDLTLKLNALTKRVDELEQLSSYGDIVTEYAPSYVKDYLSVKNKEVVKDE